MGLFEIKRNRDTREGKRPPGPDQIITSSHRLQYAALRMLRGGTRILPKSMVRALGSGLGRLYHAIDKKRRHTALRNLDTVFQDRRSESEKQAIVKDCCIHFGHMITEILHLADINQTALDAMIEWDGLEYFHEGLALGRGLLLCSAHYGNWEVMNLAIGGEDLPLSCMARPMDNPLIHDFFEDLRTRTGNEVIYKHKSVRKVLNALSENRIVGIVNDQDVHDRNRMMVPFFGHPAATTPVPAAIAYKTGAPLITGYAVPLGDGRYRLSFGPLINPNREADKDAEIERLTLLLNQRLEAQIEAVPECWMWIHQRFKTGPDGRTDFYKQPRQQPS